MTENKVIFTKGILMTKSVNDAFVKHTKEKGLKIHWLLGKIIEDYLNDKE